MSTIILGGLNGPSLIAQGYLFGNAPPPAPPRNINLVAEIDTALLLSASIETSLLLSASIDTAIILGASNVMAYDNATSEMFAGEAVTLTFTFAAGHGVTDITGDAIAWVLRSSGGGANVLTKTGVPTTPSPTLSFVVTLASSDTFTLPPGLYYYQARRQNSPIATEATGELLIQPNYVSAP